MTAKQRCGVAHQVVLYETGARGYGLREDSESNNSQYKQKMHHGRARTVGANNLRLDLLAYQCVTIITTLVAHQRRTGSSFKGWFGDCPPPYRGDPTG